MKFEKRKDYKSDIILFRVLSKLLFIGLVFCLLYKLTDVIVYIISVLLFILYIQVSKLCDFVDKE